MNLEIEQQPFASTHTYAGVFTDDQGKDFGFSVIESVNADLGISGIEDITWVDDTPSNQFEIEAQIELQFKIVSHD